MLKTLKSKLHKWWTGGEAVTHLGNIVIYRVPQSLPLRVKAAIATTSQSPIVVTAIGGVLTLAAAKILHLT
jgi:hypothetical protein